jgi:hypothetical protein
MLRGKKVDVAISSGTHDPKNLLFDPAGLASCSPAKG